MSKQQIETADQKNGEEVKNADLSFDLETSLPFPIMDSSAIMSTITFDKSVKAIIRTVFSDLVGFRPEWNVMTGRFTLSAFFEQVDSKDSDITAFKYNVIRNDDNASGADRIMRLQNYSTQGSAFSITDEAKSAFEKYMASDARDANGNVRWDDFDVVCQIADVKSTLAPTKTYNVINHIDPAALTEMLYGSTADAFELNEDCSGYIKTTHNVKYIIEVLGIMNTPQTAGLMNQPFGSSLEPQDQSIVNKPLVIKIYRLDEAGIAKASRDLGVNYQNSLNIDE